MAFNNHWNRFVKLVSAQDEYDMNDLSRVAQLAYTWGREDAEVEQRLEDERRLAGQLSGGLSEGQIAG